LILIDLLFMVVGGTGLSSVELNADEEGIRASPVASTDGGQTPVNNWRAIRSLIRDGAVKAS
jgi:hypothetical protein